MCFGPKSLHVIWAASFYRHHFPSFFVFPFFLWLKVWNNVGAKLNYMRYRTMQRVAAKCCQLLWPLLLVFLLLLLLLSNFNALLCALLLLCVVISTCVCMFFRLIYFVYQTFNVVYTLLKSSSSALKSMLQIHRTATPVHVWVLCVCVCVYMCCCCSLC